MSELKRYVLLDDNNILDVSTEIYYIKGENELYRDRPNACVVTVKIGYIKKTSDDILDLVGVNDLLELDNDWEILKVLTFNKNNQLVCRVRTSSNTEEYTVKDYRKEYIKAIYKQQLNGDYKRYEVKGVIR